MSSRTASGRALALLPIITPDPVPAPGWSPTVIKVNVGSTNGELVDLRIVRDATTVQLDMDVTIYMVDPTKAAETINPVLGPYQLVQAVEEILTQSVTIAANEITHDIIRFDPPIPFVNRASRPETEVYVKITPTSTQGAYTGDYNLLVRLTSLYPD